MHPYFKDQFVSIILYSYATPFPLQTRYVDLNIDILKFRCSDGPVQVPLSNKCRLAQL